MIQMCSAVARRWEVHRSLFAIRSGTIVGLVPRLSERVQIAAKPLPGVRLSGCSHHLGIYAAKVHPSCCRPISHPICEERVTERPGSKDGTPAPFAVDCPSIPAM
jgi:hypothetical protein